jgi:predicted unusual protein kinase regulating ubiquinone biosynthesis (AarF/ABC1/UbiB family)
MKRNAQVVSQLGGLATTLVADWKLGKWEANIKQRALQSRLLLESLGPAYVKIGQALSTRVDMLPEAYVLELEKLQDNVPVFSTMEAREVLEEGEQGLNGGREGLRERGNRWWSIKNFCTGKATAVL